MTPFQRDLIRPFEDIQPAIDQLETHLASAGHLPPMNRVRLLSQLGLLYRSSPEPARALPYFEQAVLLSRQHNLRADEAMNTLRIAVAYQYADMPDDATTAFKAALVLCTQRRLHLDSAYHLWGKFLVEQGDTSTGVSFLEQALAQRMARGNIDGINSTRSALDAARAMLTLPPETRD